MQKILSIALVASLSLAALSSYAQELPTRIRKADGHQVLVSASNSAEVLGYFDQPVTGTLPQEMQSFFLMHQLVEDGAAEYMSAADYAAATDSVGPLLGNIMFDQGDPYNRKCPVLDGGGRSVTGCVATAMAQILRYYQYPACGVGSATYSSAKGATTFDFTQHPFDWPNIKEYYGGIYNGTQADAVANLLLACGASVNMSYSSSGSGSNLDEAQRALANHFGYPNTGYVECKKATTEEIRDNWAEEMVDNFNLGHPVLFAGCPSSSAGHAFVIDGYKIREGKTYFHVNWGWSGHGNGWFLLAKLNDTQGVAGYADANCNMVFNICPPGWTDVENVSAAQPATLDLSLPIYNVLGQQVRPDHLERGMIYIQQGHKFIF